MSAAPFLLVDAGNSRVKWALVDALGTRLERGVFAHEAVQGGASGTVTHTAGSTAGNGTQADDSAGTSASGDDASTDTNRWAHLPTPRGVWISNVAGAAVADRLNRSIDAHWPGMARTTIRARATQCGVTNRYTTPSQLGSDRWAGLIGAHAAFPGEHLLLATFGTATTLEALRADGTFEGGLIAPGWALMMRSLGEHTAQLPTLDTRAARGLLGDAGDTDGTRNTGGTGILQRARFATDTPRSLSAGSALAQAALIERALTDLQDDWQVPVRLVVGGGAADEVTGMLKVPHTRHDALVLAGLALIAADSDASRMA